MKTSILALAILGLAFRGDLKIGEVVPDIAMKTLDGKDLKLADLRGEKGQAVVVFFQSQKCPSALPVEGVRKIAAKYDEKDSKVRFIAVFAYHGDSEDGIKKYCEENKIGWTCVWDVDRKIAAHLGAKKVNTTFVLDREGKLVYRGGLATRKANWAGEAVAAALEGKKAPDSDNRFGG